MLILNGWMNATISVLFPVISEWSLLRQLSLQMTETMLKEFEVDSSQNQNFMLKCNGNAIKSDDKPSHALKNPQESSRILKRGRILGKPQVGWPPTRLTTKEKRNKHRKRRWATGEAHFPRVAEPHHPARGSNRVRQPALCLPKPSKPPPSPLMWGSATYIWYISEPQSLYGTAKVRQPRG